MHLILRHKSPKTGKIEEKHLKTPPFVETDTKTHVYTAILRASNNRWAAMTVRCAAVSIGLLTFLQLSAVQPGLYLPSLTPIPLCPQLRCAGGRRGEEGGQPV